MRRGIPIFHGLSLARKILGDDMPKAELAQEVVRNWEAGLTTLAHNLEAQGKSKPGSYGGQALQIWRESIRD